VTTLRAKNVESYRREHGTWKQNNCCKRLATLSTFAQVTVTLALYAAEMDVANLPRILRASVQYSSASTIKVLAYF